MGLPLQMNWKLKQSMEWKQTDSSKEKVLGAAVSKERHAESFLEHEKTHYY